MRQAPSRQLRLNAARSISAATLLGVVLAWQVPELLGLSEHYAWRATVLICAGVPVLLWQLPVHHPFSRWGAANKITLIRATLVLLLAATIGLGAAPTLQWAVFITACIAAALDAADGWAARRTGMSSDYGARFDMETDALLILVLSILVWQFGKAGAWVLASGLMRYVFVGAAMLWAWLRAPLPPSMRRKTIAALQVIALLVACAVIVPPAISQWLCAGALVLLSASFLHDIRWLYRHASRQQIVHPPDRD